MDDLKDVIVYYKQRIEKETREDKVLRSLQKLKSFAITVELLQATGIGKTVSGLRKWDGRVGTEARKLVTEWKQVVNGSSSSYSSSTGRRKIKEEGGGGDKDRGRTEEEHGRLDHNERNGVCDRGRTHDVKKDIKWGGSVAVKQERHSPSCSPSDRPSLVVAKRIKTESKSKKKLVDAGGDGFNASMASFEDCLGLNDVKPRVVPSVSLSSSSSSSKTKKGTKVVERPNLWDSTSSKSKQSTSARNVGSPSTEAKVKLETYSPSNTPHLKDVAPPAPLPLIKKPVMNDVDILSNLPAIQTDYKPLRFFPSPDSPPPSKKRAHEMDSTTFMSSRHTRTQVFSGRKHFQYLTEVPSLVNSCVKVLQDNVSVLYDLMYAPYYIIKPVLSRCSPQRLQYLEDNNQYLLDETDDLWKALCQKQFKGIEPDEFESWRELHCRLSIARDNKLKNITATISRSMAKAVPVRQTKMAFLDCEVKPPRSVARQQAKFGTASKSAPKEQVVKIVHPAGGTKGSSRSSSSASLADPSPSSAQQQKVVKKVAPLMQKTLKFMKNRFRR